MLEKLVFGFVALSMLLLVSVVPAVCVMNWDIDYAYLGFITREVMAFLGIVGVCLWGMVMWELR